MQPELFFTQVTQKVSVSLMLSTSPHTFGGMHGRPLVAVGTKRPENIGPHSQTVVGMKCFAFASRAGHPKDSLKGGSNDEVTNCVCATRGSSVTPTSKFE